MSWRTITIAEVRLTPAEKAAMSKIQGAEVTGSDLLADVVGEFRAAIENSGGTPGEAGTIDDLVRLHVINRTRWLWLCEFPALKTFQTKERSDLNATAEKMLASILSGDVRITDPTDDTSVSGGAWGSETKIPMRTSPPAE